MGITSPAGAHMTDLCRWHKHHTLVSSYTEVLLQIFLDVLGKVLCVRKDEFSGPSYQPVTMRRLELMDGDSAIPPDDQFMVKDRSDNGSGSVGAEWRQLAVVLDRICFILFFVVMFFITVGMAH